MIVVEGWVRMAPEDIERFKPAALAMIAASRAEPGCLDYAYSIELADPGMLRIIERWKDQAALDSHFAEPHMATFRAALGAFTLTAASVKAYEASDEGRSLVER